MSALERSRGPRPRRAALPHRRQRRRRQEHADRPPAATTRKAILADQLAASSATRSGAAQALDLSLLTDGLVAEREQGITIDVAYRYFATALRKFIIADTPGHEQYTRNMVTAASTAQLAVLLVDARQASSRRRGGTRRSRICSASRTSSSPSTRWTSSAGGEDVFEAIVADFRAFAATLRHRRRALRPDVGARGRHGRRSRRAPAAGTTGRRCCDPRNGRSAADARACAVPLSRAIRRASDGDASRAATWAASSRASIAVGDRVAVLPSGDTTTVREIRTFDGDLPRAGLHAAVSAGARGRTRHLARRPARRAKSTAPAATRSLDATLCWLADASLDPRRRYLLRHTTREVRAFVSRIDHLWNVATQSAEPAPARARAKRHWSRER